MGTESARCRSVSPIAREKCIKRARKEVESLDKWGRWCATGYLAGGLVCCGTGIMFIALLEHFVQMFGNPQQAQNLMWQGFMLGMTFGFITAFTIYKGAFYIWEGINCLQGRPASRTLVEYHDAIVNVIHDQKRQSYDGADSLSQDSVSVGRTNT